MDLYFLFEVYKEIYPGREPRILKHYKCSFLKGTYWKYFPEYACLVLHKIYFKFLLSMLSKKSKEMVQERKWSQVMWLFNTISLLLQQHNGCIARCSCKLNDNEISIEIRPIRNTPKSELFVCNIESDLGEFYCTQYYVSIRRIPTQAIMRYIEITSY